MPSFSYEINADWIEIEVNELDVRNEHEPRVGIKGKVMGTPEQMRLLYKAYFKHSGF